MHYRPITSIQPVVDYLATTLTTHLQAGEQVLWLVSGGSNIAVAVETAKQLYLSHQEAARLFITLTDERYGSLSHPDENWQHLLAAGFHVSGANLYRVLLDEDLRSTTKSFNDILEVQLKGADFSLGVFGVGSDGHTAGLIPHSPALKDVGWATEYQADDFCRITMTPRAIEKLSEAVIYAVGETKAPVLEELLTKTIPVDLQPAQLLKRVPKLTLFTDV